jgi:hypothetical protein
VYQVIHEDDPRYRAAFAAFPSDGSRHVVLRLMPDQTSGWDWLAALHHDINGALRSFHYLADKARASYEEGDPRGAKVLASIDKHLRTMETLKAELIDEILPLEK